MIGTEALQTVNSVERAIAEIGRARRLGLLEWSVEPNSVPHIACHLDIDDGWACLKVPFHIDGYSFWQLACLSSELPGLTKVAMLSHAYGPELRAEAPVGEETDCSPAVVRLLSAMTEAIVRTREGCRVDPEDVAEVDPGRVDHLMRVCDEAGWPFSKRSDGSLNVDLDTRNGYFHAAISCSDSAVRMCVPLADCAQASEQAREAIGVGLLRISGMVRMARAVVDSDRIELHVVLDTMPSADELGHALSALSVASGICGRELPLMCEDEVARLYLSSGSGREQPHRPNPAGGEEGRETSDADVP